MTAIALPLAVACFLALAGFVVFAASVSRFAADTLFVASDDRPEGVVVLTGGEARVREGLRVFERTGARRVLISGVNPQTTREDLKRRARLPAPLFACCVDMGYSAQNTTGNADETASWAETWGFRRIVVVTSNYHMPRSLMELSRALPHAELVPHAVASPTYGTSLWWTSATAVRLIAVEYVKALPAMARLGIARLSTHTSTQSPPERATAARAPRRPSITAAAD